MKQPKRKKILLKNKHWIVFLFVLSIGIYLLPKILPFQTGPNPNAGASVTPAPDPFYTASPFPSETSDQQPAFTYTSDTIESDDGNLQIYTLELDLKRQDILVKPVLSHRTLFGYATLSSMAEAYGAVAAINGGFSHTNGLPIGMFYTNKALATMATGLYPVLFLTEHSASLQDVQPKVRLESNGKKLDSVLYNLYPDKDGLYIFTPLYGTLDRVNKPHTCAVVSNGSVVKLEETNQAYPIPQDGFLVSAVGKYAENRLNAFMSVGTPLEIKWEIESEQALPEDYVSAYECGNWLIKDGKIVVPDYDPWAGGLDARAPRTAVGIIGNDRLVFMVVDGRQKAVSRGVTGKELGEFMIEKGVTQAALLDGGASSEMIVDGEIVNNPSSGRERMLPTCFIVLKK